MSNTNQSLLKIEFGPAYSSRENLNNSMVDCLSYLDGRFEDETDEMKDRVNSLITNEMQAIKKDVQRPSDDQSSDRADCGGSLIDLDDHWVYKKYLQGL